MSYDKEAHKKAMNKYYQSHKEQLLVKYKNYRDSHKDQIKQYRDTHKNGKREYFKQRKQKLKLMILEKYGSKCANPNCPIPRELMDIRCLQIDHVHGEGRKESLSFHTGNPTTFYLRVLADTKGNYQLLCAYCNWLKRYENKEKGC